MLNSLSTKFILHINVKMPTSVGIWTFISMINTTSDGPEARNFFIRRYFSLNEQLIVRAHLSWAWKYNLGAWLCCMRTKKAKTSPRIHTLISAFVIRSMDSIIAKLHTCKLSLFYLVAVAVQDGLSMTWSETPKTGFQATRSVWF